MRLMCFVAVSLSLGVFVACADDKKPESAAQRAEKLAALKKKFDEEFADLTKRAKETTDPSTRRGLIVEAKELAVLSSQKAMAIAEGDPKDATGFEASLFVIEQAGRFGGGKEFDAAAAIVAEHHLTNAKVKDILPRMAYSGPGGEKFLKAAVEKATDKQVKGLAFYFLGSQIADQLDDEEDAKRIDELVAKATEFFEKAAKEAPDAKVNDGDTIAKEVKTQLDGFAAIKNLAVGKAAPDIEGTDLDGQDREALQLQGQGRAGGHLGDVVRAMPGDDPARARHGKEHEGEAVRAAQRQLRQGPGNADEVPREGTDAVGPLVRRPARQCREVVPRAGIPDAVPDRPHRRDPREVGRQPRQRQTRQGRRGTGEGQRSRRRGNSHPELQ